MTNPRTKTRIFLDHDPWKSIALFRPDDSRTLDVTKGVLKSYGLTELLSEVTQPQGIKIISY